MMNRRSILGLSALFALRGTLRAAGIYSYEKATTLTAGEKVTIHLPTGASVTASFLGATLYASAATQFELLRNGTAPTTTLVIPSEVNGRSAGAARAYHTSNVGTGTHIKYYDVGATEEKVIDLQNVGLTAGQNLTLQTTATSGNIRIFFMWRES
jgi:hypothetical protein